MTWSDVEPGLAEVTLPPQPAGAYTLQLIGQGDPPVIGPEEAMVVTAHNVEQTQVRQDRQRLRQLAATAGGQYFDGADAGQIDDFLSMLADLDYAGRSRQLRSRLDPWSTWPFLLLVTLLLAVEWWLRRRHGLL